VQCEYFTLEMLSASAASLELDTRGESFHAITVIEGQAELRAGDARVELAQFQTAVVPSDLKWYEFHPVGMCRALLSRV
jgi:mannose-6-phosphate isomerase